MSRDDTSAPPAPDPTAGETSAETAGRTPDLVVVTGMSGAGRSTALHALEDSGFEAVDNLPLGLLPRIAAAAGPRGDARPPLAVGVDVRTRDFAVDSLRDELDRLIETRGLTVRTLYLDCDDETLIRRFTETRRRHPLAADRPVADGLRLERRTLAPLRDMADIVVDTSELTVWDLKSRLTAHFRAPTAGQGPTLTVMSFAFRNGVPRESDLVFDVRFLANPHYDPDLRPLTGLDRAVGAAIDADPDFAGFLESVEGLLRRTLPRYEQEGKSYLTVAIGCTGGRHRSVYTAERLAAGLAAAGRRVHRFHRDLPATPQGRGQPARVSTSASSSAGPADESEEGTT